LSKLTNKEVRSHLISVGENDAAAGVPGIPAFAQPTDFRTNDAAEGNGDRLYAHAADRDGSPENLLISSIGAAQQCLSDAELEDDLRARHEHLKSALSHVHGAHALSETLSPPGVHSVGIRFVR
jgi:hypothetical protein